MMFHRAKLLAPIGRYIILRNYDKYFSSRWYENSVQLTTKSTFQFKNCRLLSSTSTSHESEKAQPMYEITFIKKNGERISAKGKEGDSLLDVVINNNLDFDGYGACEGTLTCSTCHVILDKEDYDRLPDKPSEEEQDMLDLAYELTDTSRLGCQIIVSKALNGLEVRLPSSINDARS